MPAYNHQSVEALLRSHNGAQAADRTSSPGEACPQSEDLVIGVLSDMIGYQLRRAQMRLAQHFATRLEDAQITPGQLTALIKISCNPGVSQTALAKANGIERSTLGEIIDRFEKRGWVERRRHVSDRRAYALHLSPEGECFLEQLLPAALDHERELTAGWSESEKQTLLELLQKLANG